MHLHTHAHVHLHTPTCSLTRARSLTHAHTYTCTLTHTYVLMHTYTLARSLTESFSDCSVRMRYPNTNNPEHCSLSTSCRVGTNITHTLPLRRRLCLLMLCDSSGSEDGSECESQCSALTLPLGGQSHRLMRHTASPSWISTTAQNKK